MDILVLLAQRKCDYPGQYAPEALACMSHAEHEENPQYLQDARQENLASGEFEAVTIVRLRCGDREIDRLLFPDQQPIDAEIMDQ